MLTDVKEALLHLVFPHVCAGCGSDVLDADKPLCLRCAGQLPYTEFARFANNPIEKLFWGRLPLAAAAAAFYFSKQSLMQRLMHQFKYRGAKTVGVYLGRQTGLQLMQSDRFDSIDALVPLPLFVSKERARGYNQAAVLCDGISGVLQKPVLTNAVVRRTHTESQTHKNRIDRWQNIEGRFEVTDHTKLQNRHVLLVDDVVTTGATLEACGRALLAVPGLQLSIATLCAALD